MTQRRKVLIKAGKARAIIGELERATEKKERERWREGFQFCFP